MVDDGELAALGTDDGHVRFDGSNFQHAPESAGSVPRKSPRSLRDQRPFAGAHARGGAARWGQAAAPERAVASWQGQGSRCMFPPPMTASAAKPSSSRSLAWRGVLAVALVSAGALVYRAVTRARVEEPSSAVLVAPAPSVPSVPSAASAHASPNEAEFHAALAATPVTIYTASWCDVCRKTKRCLT